MTERDFRIGRVGISALMTCEWVGEGGAGESHTPVPNPFREGNYSVRRFRCTARDFRRTTLPDDSESVGRPSAFEDEAWLALGAHEAEAELLRGPSFTRRPRASSCMSST